MADEQHESPERPDNGRSGSDSAKQAIRAAAMAAATTAGAAAARKAFTGRKSGGDDSAASTLTAALQSAWEAAHDHLLPHAEDAMEAVGRYLATDAPEVLRERLIPRLVEAFESARPDEGGTSRSGDE
jgi:hypothetical protein